MAKQLFYFLSGRKYNTILAKTVKKILPRFSEAYLYKFKMPAVAFFEAVPYVSCICTG
jgi:hypothetical protein